MISIVIIEIYHDTQAYIPERVGSSVLNTYSNTLFAYYALDSTLVIVENISLPTEYLTMEEKWMQEQYIKSVEK